MHPPKSKANITDTYMLNAVTLGWRCWGVNVARFKVHYEQQLITGGDEDTEADMCSRMAAMCFPVTRWMLL